MQTQTIILESAIFGEWIYECALEDLESVLAGFASLGWARK